MPLEAVMVCVDNSDYTRNGDYAPTRFESQTDAVNLVCGAKTQQNPENSVGILTTAGDRVDVLITPTTDLGRMVSELPKITLGGTADLLRGVQTAQLALKHRQNKNQKQRIIAFVGSPVLASDKELETLGKNLKKNNVSLDLVSFGEIDENTAKLDKLLNAVNSNETSHKVEVPVGPKLLSDVLLSSVIISPDGEGGGMGGEGGGDFFGINPSEDPELALALRISMEEERARQQAAEGGAAPAAGGDAAPEGSTAPAAGGAAPAGQPAASLPVASDAAVMEAMGMEDMDEELRQALMLSLQEAGGPMQTDAGKEAPPAKPEAAPAQDAAKAPEAAAPAAAPGSDDKAVMEALGMEDMDEELRQALLLSMQDSQPSKEAPPAKPEAAPAPAESAAKAPAAAAPASGEKPASGDAAAEVDPKWYQDPAFVSELLGSLPGVDINDPRIQSALKEVGGDKKEGGDGEKKEGGDGSGDASGSGAK